MFLDAVPAVGTAGVVRPLTIECLAAGVDADDLLHGAVGRNPASPAVRTLRGVRELRVPAGTIVDLA